MATNQNVIKTLGCCVSMTCFYIKFFYHLSGVPALGRGLRSDGVTANRLLVAGAIAGRLLESAVTAGLPLPEAAGATADHHLMLMGRSFILLPSPETSLLRYS